MAENDISQLTKRALEHGFMVMPFAFNDVAERALRMEALNNMLRDAHIREFVMDHIIDRLTYVRDYLINKSINFMVIAKDINGQPICVAHFIYSKSSHLLYLKDYIIKKDAATDSKMILAFIVNGAKDYMAGYGFIPKAIISSPSVKQKGLAAVNFMREMGMKFMTFEPKVEGAAGGHYHPLGGSETLHHQLDKGIVVFPLKSGRRVTDIRVLMATKCNTNKFALDDKVITRFLADLEAEDELHALYMLLSNSKFTISLRKVDEFQKLDSLLGALQRRH